jgi:hypothetical protein
VKKPSPDATEPRPSWLSEAILRVVRLPKDLPPGPGVERHTLQLLRSIEADSIPCPSSCVTNRGSIRLTFEVGDRSLHVYVTGADTYFVVQMTGYGGLPRVDVYANRVENLRKFVAWLLPGVNQAPVQMVAGWRQWD